METRAINEFEAAKMLGLAVQTLRNYRVQRRGPAYVKMGRSVRYLVDDVVTFMNARRIDPEQGVFSSQNTKEV